MPNGPRFAAQAVTPNFPDGFTVFDGQGQWRNPQTGHIARDPTKILLVAAQANPRSRPPARGGDRRLQDPVPPAIGRHHHPQLVRRVLASLPIDPDILARPLNPRRSIAGHCSAGGSGAGSNL